MEKSLQRLIDGNRAFVQARLDADPEYFHTLAKGQKPEYLWIGCSDSRVSADQITGTQPGEIFVHRNIANVVNPADGNLLAVLQYAVDVLEVKHVIVCGHYGCGGVEAALGEAVSGHLEEWLGHIRDVYHRHKSEIDGLPDARKKAYRLAELNVMTQVSKLASTSILRQCWRRRGAPYVHGWIYSIADGNLRDLGVTIRGTGL
jgi:carbonic anhydrase